MPQSRVRSRTQSGAGSSGSGSSRSEAGENGPKKNRLSIRPRRLVATCRGTLTSQTSARMASTNHRGATEASAPRSLVARGSAQARWRAMARSAPNPRRALPSVERLLQSAGGAGLVARYRRGHVVEAIRAVLEELRHAAAAGGDVPGADDLIRRVAERLETLSSPRLVRVVNATGVVLHTNLGRALLAEDAIAALLDAARHPVGLE